MKTVILILALFLTLQTQAKTELTFAQAYKKFNQATEQNNLPDKVKYSRLAYELGQQKYGESSKSSYILAYNYAHSLVSENSRKTATERVKLFKYVIDGYSSIYGANSEKLITPFMYYRKSVVAARQSKQTNKQLNFVIKGLEAINKDIEQGSLAQAEITQVLANTYQDIREHDEALELYKVSHNIYEKQLPESDLRFSIASFNLGRAYKSKRRLQDAKQYFKQALVGFTSADGRNHHYELSTRAFLISALEATGDSDEATEHCIKIGKMKPWDPNQKPKPIHRIQPKYPIKAARERLNGWAKYRFSISETGFVEDIELIDSSNRIFEKTAKNAFKKWRYAPKFVDGKAVKAEDLTVQLDFKMGS